MKAAIYKTTGRIRWSHRSGPDSLGSESYCFNDGFIYAKCWKLLPTKNTRTQWRAAAEILGLEESLILGELRDTKEEAEQDVIDLIRELLLGARSIIEEEMKRFGIEIEEEA